MTKKSDGFQIRKDGAVIKEQKALTEENIPYISRESGVTEENLRVMLAHYEMTQPGVVKMVTWRAK